MNHCLKISNNNPFYSMSSLCHNTPSLFKFCNLCLSKIFIQINFRGEREQLSLRSKGTKPICKREKFDKKDVPYTKLASSQGDV